MIVIKKLEYNIFVNLIISIFPILLITGPFLTDLFAQHWVCYSYYIISETKIIKIFLKVISFIFIFFYFLHLFKY